MSQGATPSTSGGGGGPGFASLYWEYLAPWSNPAAVDGWDTALHVGKWAGWITGAVAGTGAIAVWGWGTAGLATYGFGVGPGTGATGLHVIYGATEAGGAGTMVWHQALGGGLWVIGADSTTVASITCPAGTFA
jgi:hypothetical protein